MQFKVRVFLGDELIPEDKLKDVYINSPVVNRIVDTVVDRTYEIVDEDEAVSPSRGCFKRL